MKENVFNNACEAEDFLRNFWSEVALDEVLMVFHEWMRRFEWVSERDREYVPE
jgi:hypothetical protein